MLQGHLFSSPMMQNWKELKAFSVEKKQWDGVNQDIERTSLNCNDFVQDEALVMEMNGRAHLLKTHYLFPDNFIALMKTK